MVGVCFNCSDYLGLRTILIYLKSKLEAHLKVKNHLGKRQSWNMKQVSICTQEQFSVFFILIKYWISWTKTYTIAIGFFLLKCNSTYPLGPGWPTSEQIQCQLPIPSALPDLCAESCHQRLIAMQGEGSFRYAESSINAPQGQMSEPIPFLMQTLFQGDPFSTKGSLARAICLMRRSVSQALSRLLKIPHKEHLALLED